MLARLIFLSLVSVVLSQCSLNKKRNNSKWVGPSGELNFDISNLPNGMFKSGVPVGSLRFEQGDGSMGLCTAFAIAKNRILTNHHCIHNDDTETLAEPSQLKVIFKNRGDDQQTEVSITAIVDMDRNDSGSDYKLYKTEGHTDWALLATDQNLNRFSPLALITEHPGAEFLRSGKTLIMPRVNPPEEATPPYNVTLQPVEAELLVSEFYEESSIDTLTEKKRDECQSTAYRKSEDFLASREECSQVKVTTEEIDSMLESVESYFLQTLIRQGNSGSPILYDGKVIGIAHSGLFPNGQDGDTKIGIAQFFHNVGKRLKQ